MALGGQSLRTRTRSAIRSPSSARPADAKPPNLCNRRCANHGGAGINMDEEARDRA
jgi:hypothetical protein